MRHYTSYIDRIKRLKREKRHDEAIALLLKTIGMVEADSQLNSYALAPGYYRHLAIVYRKEKRYADEVAIVRRYAHHPYGASDPDGDVLGRARKAQALAEGNGVTENDVRAAADAQDAAIRPHVRRALSAYSQRSGRGTTGRSGSRSKEPEMPVSRVLYYGCATMLVLLALLAFATALLEAMPPAR